jgi:putative nucleotidyltransferase with HDIG domain
MSDKLSEVPLKIRKRLVQKSLGTKQILLGLSLFGVLTAILSMNVLPPRYILEPIAAHELIGISLLIFGVLGLSGLYLYDFRPEIFKKPSHLLLLSIIFVTITIFAKIFAILAALHGHFWGYLIPVAFVAMLVTVLFDSHLAIMVVIGSSIFVGFLTGYNFSYTVTGLLGGLIAVYVVPRLSERAELTKAGLLVGGGLAFFTFTISVLTTTLSMALINLAVGFTNGLYSAVLALGSLPFLERHFGIVTSMRLLELTTPNQPLLRCLMQNAPGTYNHSVAVGNLAEAAAEAVGANPLLVRAGAYYHDIGKTKRPAFFVENQKEVEGSKHKTINPNLSCLVITSHVKEGVDLAHEYNLPKEITDLIDQHHGKGIVTYFYHQAKKDTLKQGVCEETFRYTGEKPQSKEAAILMLADAVEAAAKTVGNPTATKFEQLIKKLIQERLRDGQLDESQLTLADLDKIGKSFTHTLTGVYHPRVDYPEPEKVRATK